MYTLNIILNYNLYSTALFISETFTWKQGQLFKYLHKIFDISLNPLGTKLLIDYKLEISIYTQASYNL